MKRKLSLWSKTVKKKMIDHDMDTSDLANLMKWTSQYTSSIVNGRTYQKEAVERISHFFEIDIPSEKATLAREFKVERIINE